MKQVNINQIENDIARLDELDVNLYNLEKFETINLTKEEKAAIKKANAIVNKRFKELNKTQDNLQKNCTHDFIYRGHFHNDDIYTCTICHKSEYR